MDACFVYNFAIYRRYNNIYNLLLVFIQNKSQNNSATQLLFYARIFIIFSADFSR